MKFPLLFIALALSGLTACGPKPKAAAPAKPVLTVEVAHPQSRELAGQVSAYGGVYAWQEASIGSEVGGLRIVRLAAEVGDTVKRGQVLAQLNDADLLAGLAAQKAALAEAEANEEQAHSNAERARQLGPDGAISQQDLATALTAEKTAKAKRQALAAQVAAQALKVRYTQIVAPDDGVISVKTAALGQVVSSGAELFKMVRQGRLEWRAEVDATRLSALKVGMPVQLADTDGHALQGTVRKVAPAVDAATRTGIAYVDLPKSALTPGMYVRGTFETTAHPVLTVPASALVLRDGRTYVLAVDAQSKVRMTNVEVEFKTAEYAAVSGVQPQDNVIVSGGAFLSAGDLVTVSK